MADGDLFVVGQDHRKCARLRQARTVAYGDLAIGNPAVITPDYERKVEPTAELQLESGSETGSLAQQRLTLRGWAN
jgi:hypothetical protein